MSISSGIQQLMDKALALGMMEREDEIYIRNQILLLLGINEFAADAAGEQTDESMPEVLEELVAYACRHKVIEDLSDEREILSARIMNCFLPKPSAVNRCFFEKFAIAPATATDYFYKLSRDSNYIQTRHIARNISYKAATAYGELDITINLSKPEKNPRDIAKAKTVKSTNYPKCLLCIENEGYGGRIGHPARSNHRMIRFDLQGEPWFFQYSPYVYYNEHCIVLSGEHRDMKIDRGTFARLLAFVEWMPHYFVGSNADLPIVGGSILTHDHYQGGRYEFAMAKAESEYDFRLPRFPEIECGLVKWPMSVLRLRGGEPASLVDAAEYVLTLWRGYSDPAAEIISHTGGILHNTVTPIARRRGDVYEMDLVLRNNRTDDEHPLGIFHPHADVQHIKKENIGLIEVMGLAVLPARLALELSEVEKYIAGRENRLAGYHEPWAKELKEKYGTKANETTAGEIVRNETAAKFLRVLEDAGVFKRNEKGRAAFQRFVQTLIKG
jgi:UDPglucose--hexose-1-phosphate uridylyltransferase